MLISSWKISFMGTNPKIFTLALVVFFLWMVVFFLLYLSTLREIKVAYSKIMVPVNDKRLYYWKNILNIESVKFSSIDLGIWQGVLTRQEPKPLNELLKIHTYNSRHIVYFYTRNITKVNLTHLNHFPTPFFCPKNSDI